MPNVTVDTLETLVRDAEEAFRQRGLLRRRQRFIAQYIYDALYPGAGQMDVVSPEIHGSQDGRQEAEGTV